MPMVNNVQQQEAVTTWFVIPDITWCASEVLAHAPPDQHLVHLPVLGVLLPVSVSIRNKNKN